MLFDRGFQKSCTNKQFSFSEISGFYRKKIARLKKRGRILPPSQLSTTIRNFELENI